MHRRGSTDAVAAATREGIYFLEKRIVNFLWISRTTTISMCSNRDRKERCTVHSWLHGEKVGGKILHTKDEFSSIKWSGLFDHRGLYFVQDEVFDLFIMIEFIVDSKQDKIYGQGGQGIEQVKRENLSWICEDEDAKCVELY